MLNFTSGVLESNGKYDNHSRTYLLKTVLQKLDKNIDILILPAGFYDYKKIPDWELRNLEKEVTSLIKEYSPNTIVCLGVDANDGKDQLGLAFSSKELIAAGRKFHPTADEKNVINVASTTFATEFQLKRTFNLKNKKFFLAVCYDSFGIKHKKLDRQGVDFVIDLIHGFDPKGSGNSGEVYFAKHGMAGASKHWNCPVFSSAVFFNRKIPEKWPTAVLWDQGDISTQKWKYDYNPISAKNVSNLQVTFESVQFRSYSVQ